MIRIDGSSLRIADVDAVARAGARVELDPAARARNLEARETLGALLDRGETIYGASTGVGALRDRQVSGREREQLQWNLLRSHAVTAGEPMPADRVRAAMVIRANQLGAGGAGVAPELLDGLLSALNTDLTPFTRELGALGTGDLGTLAEIGLAVLGEGLIWNGGELVQAPGISDTVTLGMRDGLGFISSNATTLGHAALLCVDIHALFDAWLTTAALSFEAVGADPVVLDAHVQSGRGSPDQTAVASRMRALLQGYFRPPRDAARPVQDPYPFRVMPPVDAVAHGALSALAGVLQREINSRSENALIADGQAWPNGNFHGAELAAALDTTRRALAQSSSLIAARVSALLEPRFSGLPQFLACEPGLDSGAMIVEYVAHSAAAEVRSLSENVAAQSVTASMGVESHASLSATSARRAADQLDALRILVACELVVAVRALRLAGRAPAGTGTQRLFAAAAQALPDALADRSLSTDIESARALLGQWRPEPLAEGEGSGA